MPLVAPDLRKVQNSMKKIYWTYNKPFTSFEIYIPASGSGGKVVLASGITTIPTAAAPFDLEAAGAPAGTYNVRVQAHGPDSAESNQVQISIPLESPVLVAVS
jgi:hypothetical protein